MANDLTAFSPEYWSREMQTIFFKENVAIALANTELREQLSDGDTLNKPYRSKPISQTYTKGTDITIVDRDGINEQLSVDTAKVVPFYVDDIDRIQNKWDLASRYAQDGQRLLNNILDQAVAGQVTNATSSLDAGDVGGSAGSNIVLSTSNVSQLFAAAARKLDSYDIPQNMRFAMIGPRLREVLRLYLSGKDTSFADTIGMNGVVAERFGFRIHFINNLRYSATWTPANNPSDGDTITINGCTLTFKTTPALAGAVDIGSTTADTLDNLILAINGSGTPSATTYIALSDAQRWALTKAGVVGTDGTTNISIVGYGDIVVAASDSGNDPWSAQQQDVMFGMIGATDLVVQKTPNVYFREAEKRLGRFVYPWMIYGIKTFTDMKDAIVRAKVNASSWT